MMNYKNVLTVCPYCGCGCNFYLSVLDNELIGVLPSKEHQVSQGRLCIKGLHASEFVTHEERLKKPLVKQNGKFVETTWENAYDIIAKKFSECKEKYTADAIACLSSAKCTNEENYLMQKFCRVVLGTNMYK